MTSSRPFGVTIIATLMLIVGVVRSILGILLLSGNPYIKAGFQQTLPPDMPDLGTMKEYFPLWMGILFLVIGLMGLLMSYGMFNLKGWAWLWTIVVASFNLVGTFISVVQARVGFDAFISVAIFVLVVYYLSTTPVRRAFGMVPHR
jgi:hypothetical protein